MRALTSTSARRAALVGALAIATAATGAVRAGGPAGAAGSTAAASPTCVPPKLNASAALPGSPLTVSPAPDTRDASMSNQISLLGAPAAALASVTARGSRTGAHAGRLLAYSQGDGASFVPSRPFAAGERVSVHVELRSAGQIEPLAWSFTIAVRDTAGAAGGSGFPAPHPRYYQHFLSRPDLQPPTVSVTTHSPAATPGDVFLAPYSGPGQYGPMILDESGALGWFKALSPRGTRAAGLRVQQYEGRPVLTWWQDPLVAGGSSDAGIVMANTAYQDIGVVRAGNGYQPDLHEFQITPQGTALMTVYSGIDCNLEAAGGPRDAAVADTMVQELDLKTGLVRFEWHSVDHVALSDSYASAAHASRVTPFDYFHINSIDVEPSGALLVDARNTWAAYELDRHTGQVRWTLGGRHSSFRMGRGTRTAWQHDARRQPDGTITFFDNGATPAAHPQSRAIQVKLDEHRMLATLVRADQHTTPLVAGSQGNTQALAGGDWMVGWGEVPYISEFDAAGGLLFDAHLPRPYESYRAYRLPWSATPTGSPALAAVRSAGAGGGRTLYASWNGATAIASWRVLAGRSAKTLAPVLDVVKNGFETAIALPRSVSFHCLAVQALDASGAVIGASRAVKA